MNEESASLSSGKKSGGSKPKKVVGKLVKKKSTRVKKSRRAGKSKKSVAKENESKLLIELLLKELVEIVIGYSSDETYPIPVSTHTWALKNEPEIAVDSTRVYVLTDAEGIKGLDHSLANVKKDERRLIEVDDHKWSNYDQFSSSHDGQYVCFRHSHKVLTDFGEHTMCSAKWLMQNNDSEDGRPKYIAFDDKDANSGVLSRDGQTLCACSDDINPITRVYRVREEAGKDPVAFMKFKLDGAARAVSGKGNRVMVVKGKWGFEIHDISNDPSRLVCQISASLGYRYALNEDGSKAAFAFHYAGSELRIVEVDKVSGSAMDQSAIVTVKVSESLGLINQLMYSDEGKLHMLHDWNKVSLFDPLTKEFILLEAPQERQTFCRVAISRNADYIAVIRYIGKGENGEAVCETIVKRKCNDSDWKDLFGCKVDKSKQATKP